MLSARMACAVAQRASSSARSVDDSFTDPGGADPSCAPTLKTSRISTKFQQRRARTGQTGRRADRCSDQDTPAPSNWRRSGHPPAGTHTTMKTSTHKPSAPVLTFVLTTLFAIGAAVASNLTHERLADRTTGNAAVSVEATAQSADQQANTPSVR